MSYKRGWGPDQMVLAHRGDHDRYHPCHLCITANPSAFIPSRERWLIASFSSPLKSAFRLEGLTFQSISILGFAYHSPGLLVSDCDSGHVSSPLQRERWEGVSIKAKVPCSLAGSCCALCSERGSVGGAHIWFCLGTQSSRSSAWSLEGGGIAGAWSIPT